MRHVVICILIFLIPLAASGQLYPASDYYVRDALIVNPAYAGSQDALSISIFDRFSWLGFEGAPKTMSLSIHAPLNNERIGLGLFMTSDIIGITSETNLAGNYALRMDMGRGKLALGLGFGINMQRTDWVNLAFQDPGDELLVNNVVSGVMPNFSLGIYYSTREYFIGLSLPMFLSSEFDAGQDKFIVKNDFKEYKYIFNAGYHFDLNQYTRLLPTLSAKYQNGNDLQINIGSQVILKSRFWLGAFYRSNKIMAGVFQARINDQLRVAYSYDFMVGNGAPYKFSSHEVMLNYVFKYQTNITGPRKF
ncbi:MAG TPA: PorP/SprF family type IX secretion system membrane protein [Bacteroidales bacterium]|nr:PorP/SprF family type IX secretion system membrane protein [Bacteroidales bacterium]